MILADKIKLGTNQLDQALTLMDAKWFAEPIDMLTVTGIPIPNNRAIIRTDKNIVLGVVGNRYVPIQNTDSFSFLDILAQQYKASYTFGYLVDNGRQTAVQITMGNDYEVRKGDFICNYITVINSFDGSIPLRAYFTPYRRLSGTQCRGAIRGTVNNVSIRHTKSASTKLEEALHVMNVSNQFFDKFKELCSKMAKKVIDKQKADDFLIEVFGEPKTQPNKDKHDQVAWLFQNGKGNGGGTVWDLYNAVSEWNDHFRYKGKGDDDAKHAAAEILTGVGIKERAFKAAVDLL